jgi:hypothetical protein
MSDASALRIATNGGTCKTERALESSLLNVFANIAQEAAVGYQQELSRSPKNNVISLIGRSRAKLLKKLERPERRFQNSCGTFSIAW